MDVTTHIRRVLCGLTGGTILRHTILTEAPADDAVAAPVEAAAGEAGPETPDTDTSAPAEEEIAP